MEANNIVWVEWLHPHPRWAYVTSDVIQIDSSRIQPLLKSVFRRIDPETNQPIEEPYVRVITEAEAQSLIEAKKPAIPVLKNMVPVTWLKSHPRYAYCKGSRGYIAEEALSGLEADGFVERASDIEISSVPEVDQEPLVKARFHKPHRSYAYSAGDIGYVKASALDGLVKSGHVSEMPAELSLVKKIRNLLNTKNQ